MTTIGTILNRVTGTYFLIADRQVSAGNLRLPLLFPKIIQVGNILVAGTGSVAEIQQLTKRIKKEIEVKKIIADIPEMPIDVNTFTEELTELLFDVSHSISFNPMQSNFIIAGYSEKEEKTKAVSISSDGSEIFIPGYYADGSGQDFLLGKLQTLWNENEILKLNDLDFVFRLNNFMVECSGVDLYTNQYPEIYGVKIDGAIVKYDLDFKQPLNDETKKDDKKTKDKK